MRRPVVLLALLAPLLVPMVVGVPAAEAGGGCHGPATDGASTDVPIEQGCFTPTVTEVEVGDTVTWTNRDPSVHNVAAVGGAWGSHELATDDRFSHRFDAAGTYVYVCTFHPGMAGAVRVVDGAEPIAAVSAGGSGGNAGNGDGPGLAGAVVVILVLLASLGGAGAFLLRRPRLG